MRIPGWEARLGVQNPQNSGRASLVLLFSSLWVTHVVGVGSDFIVIAPLPVSHCSFFFVFGHGVSFYLMGSSVLLSMVIQQLVVILGLSQAEISAHISTLTS